MELNLNDYTSDELNAMVMQITEELRVRSDRDRFNNSLIDLIANTNVGREDGAEWELPVHPLNVYMAGDTVTYEGELWISTFDFNALEPGFSGWRRVVDSGETPPPYVQPLGAHDAYQEGEQITWTDGKVYSATRNGVAHSPADSPSDWALVDSESTPPEDTEEPTDPEEPEVPTDPEEPEVPEIPEWNPNSFSYSTGDEVMYMGDIYVVLQSHTSQAGWTPSAVASLYQLKTN